MTQVITALIKRNLLSDNVLIRALALERQELEIRCAYRLRRSVLLMIPRSCPKLRILDVSYCRQVNNRFVRNVLSSCPHLEVLRMEGCVRISDVAFEHNLFEVSYGLLGLRELSVARCSQLAPSTILMILKTAASLRDLDVSYCRAMSDEVCAEMIHVEQVRASFCPLVTDRAFLLMSGYNLDGMSSRRISSISHLHLANCQITDTALQCLSEMCPELRVFDASWCRVTDEGVIPLTKCTELRALALCGTRITDLSIKAIAGLTHLESLNLCWCLQITSVGLQYLEADLPLVDFNFGFAGSFVSQQSVTTPKSTIGLSPFFSPVLRGASPIRGSSPLRDLPALTLPSSALDPQPLSLVNFVRAHPNLRSLKLDGLQSAMDLDVLQLLAQCSQLQELSIALQSADGLALVGEKCTQLKSLRLDCSACLLRPVVHAIQAPSFPNLLSFILHTAAPGIENADFEMLLSGRDGTKACALEQLELYQLNITDAAFQTESEEAEMLDFELSSALAGLSIQPEPMPRTQLASLATLVLSSAARLTDAAVAELAQRCPLLQHIELHHCPLLTADAMESIVRYCPRLRCARIDSSHFRSVVDRSIAAKPRGRRRPHSGTDSN